MNRCKALSKRGPGAYLTTLRLGAKRFTGIRKTLYAYTQNREALPSLTESTLCNISSFLKPDREEIVIDIIFIIILRDEVLIKQSSNGRDNRTW